MFSFPENNDVAQYEKKKEAAQPVLPTGEKKEETMPEKINGKKFCNSEVAIESDAPQMHEKIPLCTGESMYETKSTAKRVMNTQG